MAQAEMTQVMNLLQALLDPTRHDHTLAMGTLTENSSNSHFVITILHIFSDPSAGDGNQIDIRIRQLAGLIMKNYVFPNLAALPMEVQLQLKKDVIKALADNTPDIRNTAAILVGKISETFHISTWMDMVSPILNYIDASMLVHHPNAVDGALLAVKALCEDSSMKLSTDDVNRPLDTLIPKLLQVLSYNDVSIVILPQLKLRAIQSYNALLFLLESNGNAATTSFNSASNLVMLSKGLDGSPQSSRHDASNRVTSQSMRPAQCAEALIVQMPAFIQVLATLASDGKAEIRCCVCQSITTIASLHVAVLDGYFPSICEFMLRAVMDPDEAVAIESCEFWRTLLDTDDSRRAMLPYVQRLIECTITRLYLTKEQMEQDRVDEEEECSGEKDLNLRPIHKTCKGESSNAEQDREEAELSAKWTLRKQAALTLDNISTSYPTDTVLPFALSKIQEFFQSQDVFVKESGMLALGALASGFAPDMETYLPQLFPFLISNVADPLPEMRSIACWVLSRYCELFEAYHLPQNMLVQGDGVHKSEGVIYFEQTLQALLRVMFDPTPKVQVAACSALCLVVENSFLVPNPQLNGHNGRDGITGEQSINVLQPLLTPLLSSINKAFDSYGVKSTLVLIDSIGTIADVVGDGLADPTLTALYLPKVMDRFNQLDDSDMRLIPVFECLTSVVSVIGLETQAYVGHIYMRCIHILKKVLKVEAPTSPGDREECEEIKDFAICALDLLSALCEGLKSVFVDLVNQSETGMSTANEGMLFELLRLAMNDLLPELRQSAFSLCGEVCKNAFELISVEKATVVLKSIIPNLSADFPLVSNNAAWALGELSIQVGGSFLGPYINAMMHSLISALQDGDMDETLKVNIGVTIGRLAMVNTEEVSLLADEFFADWCSVLSLECPVQEKVHAFSGLIAVIRRSPEIVVGNKSNIYSFLLSSVSWNAEQPPPTETIQGLRDIIVGIRSHDQVLWARVMSKFQVNIGLLQHLYGV